MSASGDAERHLIARARDGDREAYGMLVSAHQQLAFRTAYLLCGDAGEAQDAAQEAFIKAYRSIGRFREGAPFRPWLLTIVANEARNRRRSAGRRAHLATRAAAGGRAAVAPGADVAVLAGAHREELVAALRELSPDHREVLVLRYLLDLSEAECAAVLGCRPGTVKSRHARALERLRAVLQPEASRA